MVGRRVSSINDVANPGDYCVGYAEDNAIGSLWFVLPSGDYGRIAAIGHGQPQTYNRGIEPEWTITEDVNGLVTVDPSIDYLELWHGHLISGIWSP